MNKIISNKHLQSLEDEAIFIIRETIAEFENPVLLYSIGKDSSVLLHLLLKAFYPAKPPIKIMHIDTGWKFKEMIKFRDQQITKFGLDLIIHSNPRGKKENITPFSHGSKLYTDIMKTEALKQALDQYKFDAAIGGARRDEEKSRAKERIFSHRNEFHNWDPKNQRAELFNLFNTKLKIGESMRIFPLSNWTELDIWLYIKEQNIEIVPLYFAKKRKIINRDNIKIMIDDERIIIKKDEQSNNESIRFRTLGCYPLTSAVNSQASNLDDVIKELINSNHSERHGRLIDSDQSAAMERKKREGYF